MISFFQCSPISRSIFASLFLVVYTGLLFLIIFRWTNRRRSCDCIIPSLLILTVGITTGFDLILMDVYTLDGENGIEAAAKIKKDFPRIKIIIVTSMPEESFIRKAREAGCESFWYKDVGVEDLLSVMDRTMAGESVYPDDAPVIKIGLAKSTEFTKRELDVLRELVNGHSQKDIADILGIKYDSVRTHLKSILLKTGYDTPSRFIAEVSHKNYMIPAFYESSREDEDTEK